MLAKSIAYVTITKYLILTFDTLGKIWEPIDSVGACMLLSHCGLAQPLAPCSSKTSYRQEAASLPLVRETWKEPKLAQEEFQAADPIKPTRWVCGPRRPTEEVLVDGRDRA